MERLGFETKKAFLEYLGKNPNDRKLVDRMIHDGRACMRNGMYYLMSKDDIIEELGGRIKELEKSEWGEQLNSLNFQQTLEILKLKEELGVATVNSEYWEKECRRYWRLSTNVIDICYNKFKQLLGSKFQESKEDFKDGIIEMI